MSKKKQNPATKKNKNATTVVQQKRKAKSIAKKAADKLEQGGKSHVSNAKFLGGRSDSDEERLGMRLSAVKRGRKKQLKAGKIRRSAAKIK